MFTFVGMTMTLLLNRRAYAAYFPEAFHETRHPVRVGDVRDPDGIVKIVNDLAPENISQHPFKNRRPQGRRFAVNIHKVVRPCLCDKEKKPFQEAFNNRHRLPGIGTLLVQDLPSAFIQEGMGVE